MKDMQSHGPRDVKDIRLDEGRSLALLAQSVWLTFTGFLRFLSVFVLRRNMSFKYFFFFLQFFFEFSDPRTKLSATQARIKAAARE